MPEGGAAMVLIDCREWTRTIPPSDPTGDRPGFFIENCARAPGLRGFFAPPEEGR